MNTVKLQLDSKGVRKLAQDNSWPAPLTPWPKESNQVLERIFHEQRELGKIRDALNGVYIVSTN